MIWFLFVGKSFRLFTSNKIIELNINWKTRNERFEGLKKVSDAFQDIVHFVLDAKYQYSIALQLLGS